MARQAQSHEAFVSLIFFSSYCVQHMRPLPSAPLDLTFPRAPPPVRCQHRITAVWSAATATEQRAWVMRDQPPPAGQMAVPV